MKYKIGIYGSKSAENEKAVQLARELGSILAQNEVIVITGGCSGIPYLVAHTAKQQGAEIWGFTPEHNEQEQQQAYPSDDMTIYDRLFFIPAQFDQHFFLEQSLSSASDRSTRLKYRNFLSTTHVHAGIILAGGWGTMNEFTNLLYDGKAIGVLTGTGGLADELPDWYLRLRKKSESLVYFRNSPMDLVLTLLQRLKVVPESMR
jgi:predicted Rossmann-fold nucleotide-binding protein